MLSALLLCVSCSDFLKENPKTFLSPDNYFKTEKQMEAAVNGLYTFADDIFNGDIEVGTQRFIFLEYMTGYGRRPRAATSQYLTQAQDLSVTEENNNLEGLWQSAYSAIENCNSVIQGLESAADVQVETKTLNAFIGESYFLRAYYYFNLVRLWGDVPLKTTSTADLSDVKIELSSVEKVYDLIVSDLTKSEDLLADASWTRSDGHISKGAVKSLLAKVYLTMAGYPLQAGSEYYGKAYDKAKEVYDSKAFSLFQTYADLRSYGNANIGEFIFSIQRDVDYAGSPVHNDMLPYPEPSKAISANSAFGGALAPTREFYNSYAEGDVRTAEQNYYYTEKAALDGSGPVTLDSPYIYKYWDNNAASTGKSGMNYPLIRYADVLLVMAEAKAMADGGSTTDSKAIDAYYAVRHRAMPEESKPISVSFEAAYRERLWELCFETQTWFDLLRTRKALNVITGNVVDLVGYQAPGHTAPFGEEDLLFPYPLREKRLNPNLVRK